MVLAVIWDLLGPPRWNQVRSKSGCLVMGTPPLSDLKLDVFEILRLGGFQVRFWRLQASILELPKLDCTDIFVYSGRISLK